MAIGMASTTAGILPLLLLVFLGLSGASASTLTATDAITIPIAQDVGHEVHRVVQSPIGSRETSLKYSLLRA